MIWAVDEFGKYVVGFEDEGLDGVLLKADGEVLKVARTVDVIYLEENAGSVDLLCATHKPRRGWMDFMLAQFEAQVYPHKRLIILEVSPSPNYFFQRKVRGRADVCYIWRPDAPGFNLGRQRNKLLEMVEGDWFAWFDDDEIRDSYWLNDLLYLWDVDLEAVVVTPKETRFVDVTAGGRLAVKPYQVPTVSSQSAIFRGDLATRYRVSEVYEFEEVPWLQAIAGREKVQRVDGCWVWQLIHGGNVGNTWERVFGGGALGVTVDEAARNLLESAKMLRDED